MHPGAAEWRSKENAALAMRMRDPRRGLWRDYSAGTGGDLMDLVAREFCGLESAKADFPKVLEEAARYCGIATDRPVDETLLRARAADRERQAQEAEQREMARRAALVKDLAGRAVPVGETPAAAYLASRGITDLPETGLAYLPPVPGVPVLGPEHPALVVWAVDEAGAITGGQRILIGPDGSKVETDVRKPSFGSIGGSVARFPAREGREDGPLVIAEGPESALSIWQELGHETWAVFGVSGFMSAPVPPDREVILAPDRDAPDSPAGRAFRKAVAHHLARAGRNADFDNLRIAVAPEPVGSKRDLNDTLMREDGGADAVRAAIAAARPVQAYLSPDLNAGQRAAAEAMLDAARLTLVTGHAGVGKTFTLREAARVWRDRGVQVLAGAPSGKATQELAGIPGVEAATLSAWEARWARQALPEQGGFVFFMDEAGMVGLGQWSRLQARIEAMGGKLIALGDREQLQPVNDMSGWAVAERQVLASGGTIPVIDLVIRQQDERDGEATANLARGDVQGIRAGLRHYVETGALRLDDTTLADPVAEIARAYFAVGDEEAGPGESGPDDARAGHGSRALAHYDAAPGRIALAYTNSDVEALNAAIRDEAVRRGLLDAENARVFEIERIARGGKEGGEAGAVARTRAGIEIGAGDRIILTRPHEALNLPRSGFGTVVSVSETGFEVLMDGRKEVVEIDAGDFPYFDHGYAATIHKAQGMTERQVLALPHRLMDRYAMNVVLTRHAEKVTVFGRAQHCESVRDFYRLGLRRGREYEAPGTGRKIGSMVPLPSEQGIRDRADWALRGIGDVSRHHSFLSDRHLVAVATRVAGLLSADHAVNDPLLNAGAEDPHGYADAPRRVIDDLVKRQGVVRADEVASVLARLVSDPETFQRLFREAMSHPDLVALPAGDAARDAAEPWVYTTETLLKAELAAVDRGMRLAVRGVSGPGDDGEPADIPSHETDAVSLSPQGPAGGTALVKLPEDLLPLTAEQRGAVISTLAPGGLRIVRGGTGSGKTRVAAAVARAHEDAGRVVTVVSPTQAGQRALAGEGITALTLGEFFAGPVLRSSSDDPQHVVILDDAHGLGIGRADVVLARVEAMGAKLVALVNPDRRPAEAGPVFNVLARRVDAVELTGLHGFDRVSASNRMSASKDEALLTLAQGLRSDHDTACREALKQARAGGVIQAAGDRDSAIAMLARDYVADHTPDKLVLGWGRAEQQALTHAIRARLDAVNPERRAFSAARYGPLKGLKPGDRIRFTSSGVFGSPAQGKTDERTAVGPHLERIQRGDTAEVLGSGQHGSLWLRVTGGRGREEVVREIAVAGEGPLPRWQFTFASTIMAAAGRRHESIHLLGSGGMDREVLTAGALAARGALNITLPVEESRLDDVLGQIAGRVRPPRSGLHHGFDAEATLRMALDAPPSIPGDDVPGPLLVPGLDPDEPEMDHTEIARLAEVPKVSLSAGQVRRANVAWLKDNPDQILAIVQTDRPVFTEADIRQGLRSRLGHALGEADIQALGDRAMASGDLIQLKARAPDGNRQYITVARAAVMQRCAEDAGRLATGVFEPNVGLKAGRAAVVKPDALSGLNPVQRAAAEAMLSPERLVLVQGHAGVGKTFTLGKVAQGWRDRGVTVLAGAPSGKATDELASKLEGVQTRTLAAWEAAWARGEVPPSNFVFIMDEAGMVGVGQWSRLQRQVAAMGGKLIAVGDPDQFQPVSDLPGWAVAEGAVGHSMVMDTVLRQSDLMDREATEALARGGEGVAAALRYYAKKGAIRLEPEVRADPIGVLARAYWNGDGSRIAVAATNRDVAQLNDAIRLNALAGGKIDPNAGIDPATIKRYGRITRVFTGVEGRKERVEIPLDLGVGERIMLTQAHRDLGLPRSSFGTVVAAREKEIDVRFDGGDGADPVTLDLETFRDLDYGYAATGHKAQGLGVDHVHVLPHRRMHRHAVYVVLSRHEVSVTVYGRAGHAETLADLIRMGQAAGHLDIDGDELSGLATTPAAGMVPGGDIVGLGLRADWQAQTGTPGSKGDLTRVGFAGDAELMAVAERHVGLLAERYRKGDPVLNPDVEDRRNYARFPRRVVDDLVARNSVLRAEDVATRLARVVRDPETFLRLYRGAMTHPDLMMLSEGGDAGNGPNAGSDPNAGSGVTRGRVYTTRDQLTLELDAVDLGTRLALAPVPKAAPTLSLHDLERRDRALEARLDREMPQEHRDALHYVMAPGRLRLVRGEAGSGKVAVAAETAACHEKAGWQVLSVTPTGAGLEALEKAGVEQPRTLRRFMAETAVSEDKPARVQLDPATVVVLSEAGRLGAREMAALLERVEASGAKLVAFLGGEEQAPIEAGAVTRALDMRVGSAWLGRDRLRDAGSARVVSGLVKGGAQADRSLEALSRFGSLIAGGTARRALEALAESYVADPTPDRIALTWGRADARAVTQAIRAKLDATRPERGLVDTDAGLKPGDRIRFLASTPWVPPAERSRDWDARRVLAGERAEVVGLDSNGTGLVLRVTARGGEETRDITLDFDPELPEWDYAFAGTIHGEGALVRDNVHLLVSPGMTRQVLAAGVAAHCSDIKLVVPSSEARMEEVLTRILRREGRAESVLDYGFDPAFGAREAMRGRSVELHGGGEDAPEKGIDAAITRLASLAGLDRPERGYRATPSPALGEGLEGEVLAEVIGAAILRDGQALDRMSASSGADRLAVERYVRALSDGRDWRRLLRQLPVGLPGQADDMARREAGVDPEGRLLGTARVLARGALAARALGEEQVAGMFEAGLMLYGRRAEMARVQGRMEDLLPERPERGHRVARAPEQELPDPKDRPETPEQRRQRKQRDWERNRLRARGRRRGLLSEIMAGVHASDEQVARMALDVMGISDRPRRRARTMAYAREVEAQRKKQAAAAADRSPAAPEEMTRGEEHTTVSKTVDYTGMARELVDLIAAQNPTANALQPADMNRRLAVLLERADAQLSGPWSRPGAASMEQLTGRLLSLPGLESADKALAEVVGRVLPRDKVKPVEKATARDEVAARSPDDGLSTEQGQEGIAPDIHADREQTVQDQTAPDRAETAPEQPEQLSLPLPPAPSRSVAQDDAAQQPVPPTGAADASASGSEESSPGRQKYVLPGPERDEYGYPLVDWDALAADNEARIAEAQRGLEEARRLEEMAEGSDGDITPDADRNLDGGVSAEPRDATRDGEVQQPVAHSEPDAGSRQDSPVRADMEETGIAQPQAEAGKETGSAPQQEPGPGARQPEAGSVRAGTPVAQEEPAEEPVPVVRPSREPEQPLFVRRNEWDGPMLTPRPTPGQKALALQLAISLSRSLEAEDPLHKHDLPHDLGLIVARGDHMMRGRVKNPGLLHRVAALGHFDTTRAQRGIVEAIAAHVKDIVDYDDLPDYDRLIRDRRAVLDALSAPDRPGAPPPALIRRMGQVFTQSEIVALTAASEVLPDSLKDLEADARARISEYLTAEVEARQQGLVPDAHEREMNETEEEKVMDQKQAQVTRGSDAQRESILTALLLKDVDRKTFTDLRKAFDFREIQALKNPGMELPESLPPLTAADRKTIAAVFAAGPPRPNARSGGGATAARFEPDPRYDGRALQLACAITERVDARDPVHRRNLVVDIRSLLKAADAAARTLPADKVAEAARELTTARVTLDTKLALAVKVDDATFDRPLFLRNVGPRNPDPKRMHPLEYAHRQAKEAYDRNVEEWVQRALESSPQPTQAELSVARIALLPDLPDGNAGLVQALKYIFRDGSLKPVEDLLKEREALLTEIADTQQMPKRSETVLERVFRTFTHREVFALARSGKPLPGTVPALDENRRVAVARGLTTITKAGGRTFGAYAWKAAAQSLEDGLHPERARSRARSRGMGMGM